MIEFSDADVGLIQKANEVMMAMAGYDHMADFPWSVELARQCRAFGEMIENVETAGITPGTFVAVHTLATLHRNVEELAGRNETRFAPMREFFAATTADVMGSEIVSYLAAWSMPQPAAGEQVPVWKKIGMIAADLEYMDRILNFGTLSRGHTELEGYYRRSAAAFKENAAAAAGLSPRLDALYQQRAEAVGKFVLEQLGPPPAQEKPRPLTP